MIWNIESLMVLKKVSNIKKGLNLFLEGFKNNLI